MLCAVSSVHPTASWDLVRGRDARGGGACCNANPMNMFCLELWHLACCDTCYALFFPCAPVGKKLGACSAPPPATAVLLSACTAKFCHHYHDPHMGRLQSQPPVRLLQHSWALVLPAPSTSCCPARELVLHHLCLPQLPPTHTRLPPPHTDHFYNAQRTQHPHLSPCSCTSLRGWLAQSDTAAMLPSSLHAATGPAGPPSPPHRSPTHHPTVSCWLSGLE